MKKAGLLFMLLLAHNAFAQPVITQAQFALSIGDVLTRYPQMYAPPTEGPNQTWDYTNVDLTATPLSVNVIDGDSSTLAGLPPSTLCAFSISSSQEECFLIDATGVQRTGLGGSGANLPYQDHEYILGFPITYGDSITDSFRSEYTLGSFPGSRTGTITVKVVGYGTLMLPGLVTDITVNDAMLVKTHELYIDSVDVGSWNITNLDFTTYYLYAAGYDGYIILMTTGTYNPGGSVSFGYYSEMAPGFGIDSYDISNNFEIYPNPVQHELNITNKGNISLTGLEYKIINILGAVIETGIITNENMNLDVSVYAPGMYTLSISNESFHVSKKFIRE